MSLYRNQIKIFAVIWLLLVAVIGLNWVFPMARDVRNMRTFVMRLESQYAMQTNFYLTYEYNLQEIEILNEMRRLLTIEELTPVLSNISDLAVQNNLRSISFTANESVGFDVYRLERVAQLRVLMTGEGFETDVLNFLYDLEKTAASILVADVVWDEDYRATMSLEMVLLSQ